MSEVPANIFLPSDQNPVPDGFVKRSEEMALISRAEWDKFQFCYKTLLDIKLTRDSNHPEWYKLFDWSVLDK